MARQTPVQELRNDPPSLEAKIVSAIGVVGPRNVAQISRMTRAHQETIRYKIKRQFVDKGFRFQADVDYHKLGLDLYWGTIVLPADHRVPATRFFRSLNDLAYLIHFSKIIPQGHFVALFALPENAAAGLVQFLEGLKSRLLVSEFSLDRVSAQRHKTMDPTFFDFHRARWDIDWERVRRSKAAPLTPGGKRAKVNVDELDLLLIKELQRDARQHVSEIGRKVKISPKTLEYHYRNHIVGDGLVPGYRVRWMKDTDEPLARSTASMRVTFRNLDADQYRRVQPAMNRLPYLWVEDLLESGTYIATLAVPLGDLSPTMKYVSDALGFLGDRVEMGFLHVEESYNYTIPYQMFTGRGWSFDVKKMESAVAQELKVGLAK